LLAHDLAGIILLSNDHWRDLLVWVEAPRSYQFSCLGSCKDFLRGTAGYLAGDQQAGRHSKYKRDPGSLGSELARFHQPGFGV
jgi:hypothetical protein